VTIDLALAPSLTRVQAADLLVQGFDEPAGWRSVQAARREVERILTEGFARAIIDSDGLVGWIGGLPEYSGRVWELHPIVVRRRSRRRGYGRHLVNAFEREAIERGALTITLGTDDNTGMTSLSGANLFEDTLGHLAKLRDLGRGHPFLFYRRLGFVVTGVMPDANGPGRPDIYMSKPVRPAAAGRESREQT